MEAMQSFRLANQIGKMLDPLKQQYTIEECSRAFAMFIASWNMLQDDPKAVMKDWNKRVEIYMAFLSRSGASNQPRGEKNETAQ
jgi:hypothetical protein